MKHFLLAAAVIASFTSAILAADPPAKPKDRKTQVLEDRQIVGADEAWVYNDLAKGIAEAKKTGKPLLVVFRCIPCHACAGFDAKVLNEADKRLRERMQNFVCVRIVQGNAMDLAQFQFDYDLSFTAFFMNADGTIYGRYGTRSDLKDTERDLSMESFEKAMDGAVELHKGYPANKASLTAKRGPDPKVTRPEQYPTLAKYRPELDYDGKVVESCLHCHQIRDAQRVDLRRKGEPMTDEIVFPWPMPDVVGMKLDAKEKAKVVSVTAGSAAAKAGIQVGDEIAWLNGQPIISIADVQAVLHFTPATGGPIKATLKRGSATQDATITLVDGWRKASDISWRTTSWEFRRMGLGGMLPGDMTDEERKGAGLDTKQMAFLLKHVGEYGEHARAKQAGFRKGDIITAWDGMTTRMTESTLLAYAMQKKKPGDKIEATVLREGKKVELVLTMP
jgi:hypothetical protein